MTYRSSISRYLVACYFVSSAHMLHISEHHPPPPPPQEKRNSVNTAQKALCPFPQCNGISISILFDAKSFN